MTETFNTYGTFTVTTEGDCEGRTVKHLGTHTGFIDEIAFALSDKSYYSLYFAPVAAEVPRVDQGASSVSISMAAIGTGDNRHLVAARAFGGRPVTVKESNWYGTVTLTRKVTPEMEAKIARETALAKLSAYDRAALGV